MLQIEWSANEALRQLSVSQSLLTLTPRSRGKSRGRIVVKEGAKLLSIRFSNNLCTTIFRDRSYILWYTKFDPCCSA
jgi:hypothetical protein